MHSIPHSIVSRARHGLAFAAEGAATDLKALKGSEGIFHDLSEPRRASGGQEP